MKERSKWIRNLCSLALCLAALTLQTTSSASNYFASARILDIGFFVNPSGSENTFAFVEFSFPSGGIPGGATCSTPAFNRSLIWDTSTPKGRALLTLLMGAMLAGKAVEARGTGDCNPAPGFTWGPGISNPTGNPTTNNRVELLQQIYVKN